MSGTHGVFQHRTGYFYTILEEDFCEMYKAEGINEVCRAYITSILENLTNKQFDGTGDNKEVWVYISLPEMARRMRNAYSERTIHKEVQGMIKDGYLKKRRATNKATMEYCLNLKKIRDGLTSLPDKQSCNSATSNLANLQDQSGNSARLTLQFCNNDLAELQPRITNRRNKEETKDKEESIGNEVSESQTLAPNVAPSSPSFSSLPSQEETKASSKKKEKKIEPVMVPQDAPWPSRETVVQIVEAKKGRIYSDTTRKQELQEAGKILEMTFENAPITREQFESAWDELASSSWWEEHGKPCMIKYLRRDDTIVGILKKLAKKGQARTKTPAAQAKQTTTVRVDDEAAKRNFDKMVAAVAAQGAR